MSSEDKLKLENLSLKIELERAKDLLDIYRKDPLTGLKLRRDFESKFTEFFNMGVKFYLVIADVNGLHALNRSENFKAGDALIKRVALNIATFTEGLTYRIGGDEFASLCINKPTCIHNDDSICAVICSSEFENEADMFDACDKEVIRLKALYYKENGHNRRG